MHYIGIDISKQSFDVAMQTKTGYRHYKFENNLSGFRQFVKLLDYSVHWCVMEASGPYYQKLAVFLYTSKIGISVINPLVIRRFCQMRLIRAKTDKKDATMIAEYGQLECPKPWEPDAGYILELKQLRSCMDQLNQSRTNFIRQYEAFKQGSIINKDVLKTIRLMIRTTEKQLNELELKMETLMEQYHAQMYKQVKSVPGIGKKTGLMLIVISAGFTKFTTSKQLSSYVGLSPRIFESGSSVKGKARICKMGMSRIRAMLYVCSWSAIKCNQVCKQLYDRMIAKGKPKMVALIAVANKLLKQVFAVATKQQFYNPEYMRSN